MNLQPVNLLWQRRCRGLLPLSANAVADDGSVVLVRPDELEARTYQVLAVAIDGQASELVAVSVETMHKFEVTPGAEAMVGVTDDDVYLFREGRKTRFLADRRVTYSDLALARDGRLFGCAFSDLLFASHTVALGEIGGRMAWTKEVDAAVNRVAISADGRLLAIGCSDGSIVAVDQVRAVVWECLQQEPVSALSLAARGAFCAAGTEQGNVLGIDDEGAVAWQMSLGLPVRAVVLDAAPTCVAAAAGDTGGGILACASGAGVPLLEHDLEAQPTGLAISPNGRYLAVSLQDGSALLFETDFRAASGAHPSQQAALERADVLLARDEVVAAYQQLRTALEENPGLPEVGEKLEEIAERLIESRIAEARAASDEGQLSQALSLLDEAQQLLPYNEVLFEQRRAQREAAIARLEGEAGQHTAAGDDEDALRLLSELLRLAPERTDVRRQVAAVRARIAQGLAGEGDGRAAGGDLAGAMELWQRAQLLSDSPELQDRLRRCVVQRSLEAGRRFYEQQRFAEAAFQFKRVLALEPDHEEAIRYLGYTQGAGRDSSISTRFQKLE
jgi:tetratricopeptide (TPR) repeat protein